MVHRYYACQKTINSTEYLYVYLFYKKINKIHCYANCMTQITISFLTPTIHCHVNTLIVLHFTTKSATFQSSSTFLIRDGRYLTYPLTCLPAGMVTVCRAQLKPDDTRWSTVGVVKGKHASGVGSQYPSHYLRTWCIQHYYSWCAHLGCQ